MLLGDTSVWNKKVVRVWMSWNKEQETWVSALKDDSGFGLLAFMLNNAREARILLGQDSCFAYWNEWRGVYIWEDTFL
jgi:hypothetical protein